MSNDASMARYYAERASEYERIYFKLERQADLQTLHNFIESSFADADVLEVACGTGYWTEVLARSAKSVIATDINEEVLAIARSKGLPESVTFLKADAYALPTRTQPSNAGLSAFWWSHIPKSGLRDFLRGFHRALAPGSRVVFIDNVYVEGSSTPFSRTDPQGDSYQLRQLDDGSIHEVRKNFPPESELLTLAESLASDVKIEFLPYFWTLSYITREEVA